MSSETELKKWLHRTDKSHLENIEFAMKVWNSMEFNLLTKHEIITEECCKIVEKLSAEVESAEDIDAAWSILNEFFALKCSPGAVVSTVKITLTKTLVNAVKSMRCQRYIVYKALITTLKNSAMQSFFKSSSKYFAMLVGTSVDYLAKMLDANELEINRSDPLIVEVVQITKTFMKQTPFLKQFRKPFVKNLLVPLSELFISLRKDNAIDESDFFSILHEIYFAEYENEIPINQLLLNPESEDFAFLLNVPVHVFVLIVEGVFQSVTTTTQGSFIKFLFDTYFKQSNEKFANENQMLMSLSLFLLLLKRYDVSLNYKIDGLNATEFIGKHIESLNITESTLYEILLVLCASIELNPMMLEQSTIPLVVKCMLHRKDDRTVAIFERFLTLVIDMYRRLSRSEKFISNLTRTMWQKLSDFKLSKKIKRKIGVADCNASVSESPKRLRIDSVGNVSTPTALNDDNQLNRSEWFLQLLSESTHLNDETKPLNSVGTQHNVQWKNIQFAWPNRVGETFSKYISGLVSKPSLVVWKTLIFTLTDYVKLIKDGDLSENSLFLIDWTSALLCQYFDGCRLAEQSDKTWELIDDNRQLQRNLLKDFGNAILSQEHNIRTMNAFLSLCHSSGNFDLLSWFYCPDSITTQQIQRSIGDNSNDFVHSYLQPTEWVLIEQRISNFGKHECRSNLNRLYMQKIKSKLMLKSSNGSVDVVNDLLASTLGDHEGLSELNDILLDKTTNQWFIEQLTRSQKIHVARSVVELDCDETRNSRLIRMLANRIEDQEFFDFLAVAIFERIGVQASDKIFKRIDFQEVFGGNESVCKEALREMKNVIIAETNLEDQSQIAFELLDGIPLGFVSPIIKNILLHLTMDLLQYTTQVNNRSCCKYLKKLLLHGASPDVFRYLKVKQLPRIFDRFGSDAKVMCKFFFEKKLIELGPSTSKMLEDLLQLIQNETFENSTRCSYLDIGIHLLDFFHKSVKCKEIAIQYREVIFAKIKEFFDDKIPQSPGDEETFVSKTASGFVYIISSIREFDETLKRIVKIYSLHMRNCYDSHSIKLLNIISTNRAICGYSDSDISKMIEKFWNSLISDLNSSEDPDIFQSFIKFVINFKSCEELMDMFSGLNLIYEAEKDVIAKCKTFELLFRMVLKCNMNKTKANMFSEFFRQASFQFLIRIRTFDQPTQRIIRHQLLDSQKQICNNIKVPMSFGLIDDIISFMSETLKCQEIKKITDASTLKETHIRLSNLCHSLILHRHYFIVDRIPQIVVILKDLLQLICWYKCDRARGKHLDDNEVTTLAELSHKLENVIKAFVKHARDVKRVAPYLLLFIMNLMITKENVSTMYSQIKTHFDYICYDLISVCDHRVNGFIMRNCNEASKQHYETLVKEYDKYHKFKGKV